MQKRLSKNKFVHVAKSRLPPGVEKSRVLSHWACGSAAAPIAKASNVRRARRASKYIIPVFATAWASGAILLISIRRPLRMAPKPRKAG